MSLQAAQNRITVAFQASPLHTALTDPTGAPWNAVTTALTTALGDVGATNFPARASLYMHLLGLLRQAKQAHDDNNSQIAMARSPAQRAAVGTFLLNTISSYASIENTIASGGNV
jgi:hypothetical protein